jgi:nickel-dependent lactate racemase
MIEAVEPLLERQIFSIMTVVDPKGEIYACTSGHLHDSFYAATEMAHLVYAVKIKEQVDVVVSAAVHPMDINLFQAQKALETGKLALKDGGILILVARCQKGIGQETFTQLLGRADSPEDALRLIQGEYKLGYHKAAKMAEIGKWAQIWGVTDLDDSTLESVFIKPYGDLQEAVEKALAQKGPQAQILFMPAGSLTVPSL